MRTMISECCSRSLIPIPDPYFWFVIEVEADEAHAGAPRFGVQALFEAIGADVAIKDRDFSLGIEFFDLQARS